MKKEETKKDEITEEAKPKNKKKKNNVSANLNNKSSKASSKTTTKKNKKSSLKNETISTAQEPVKDINGNPEKVKKEGRFHLDILDILIIVVLTSIVSCVLTGFILNYQYRHSALERKLNTDENINEFLDTYSKVVDNYYEEVDKKGMIEAAIAGMLEYLEDNYSIYLDKDETEALSEILDSAYDGIGIIAVNNVVYRVYEDSPAAKQGIEVNDEIIKVNGTTINDKNYEIISELIDQNKNDTNEIVVKRKGKELTFNIEKSKVTIPVTETDVIKINNKNIGYLTLTAFSKNSFEEFQESLLKLEKEENIDSLIIDLRNNQGGYLNSAYDIASLFIKKDQIIYSLESKNKTTEYKDTTDDARDYKIVILVNNGTASSAEVLTAALKDSYGATIVGTTTYGKGKVQTTMRYGDTMIKYTSSKWLRPNGDCIDEKGIEPDYEVDIEYKNDTIYDKQLDKAIALLK